jgi:hypothetical protein
VRKLVNSEEIAFGQHILNIKHLTEIIDDFNGIFKTELTLFDGAASCVYADWDSFSVVPGCLGKGFNVLEITDRVGQ